MITEQLQPQPSPMVALQVIPTYFHIYLFLLFFHTLLLFWVFNDFYDMRNEQKVQEVVEHHQVVVVIGDLLLILRPMAAAHRVLIPDMDHPTGIVEGTVTRLKTVMMVLPPDQTPPAAARPTDCRQRHLALLVIDTRL